ncbi:hypothetical protein QBC40DRAFT_197175 [Triangularia verruculosa]|uniref:Uncharacterized protein n=1 Tax=Triangularia verruculosa TaxID=2587418 RepID=A0AAN7AXF7_9PEZI|nr:hypothetical protein QBC40DRAFT_197175 [Triangularia verruculosa]
MFPLFVCCFLSIIATSFGLPTEPDFGYWNLTIIGGASATGWRYQDTTSIFYAADAEEGSALVKCHWVYSPETRNETMECTDSSFSYQWGDEGRTRITVQQTLNISIDGEARSTTLGGTADVTLRYGTSANGRGFEGKVLVLARRCCLGRMND